VILAFFGTVYQAILAVALKSGTLISMEPASPEGLLARYLYSAFSYRVVSCNCLHCPVRYPREIGPGGIRVVLHELVFCRCLH
jgi:hypothetical protein